MSPLGDSTPEVTLASSSDKDTAIDHAPGAKISQYVSKDGFVYFDSYYFVDVV